MPPPHCSPAPLSTSLALIPLLAAGCGATRMDLDYSFDAITPAGLEVTPEAQGSFEFVFEVVPTGVYFTVTNHSATPASIDWAHCFFIDPSGNTYNALNTDILDESNEVARKSVNRTQLPAPFHQSGASRPRR